jgi:hypothetical protein
VRAGGYVHAAVIGLVSERNTVLEPVTLDLAGASVEAALAQGLSVQPGQLEDEHAAESVH